MSTDFPRPTRRRALGPAHEWVRVRPLLESGALPALVEPSVPGIDLPNWAEAQRETLERELVRSGGLLFRGFTLAGLEDFERFVGAASGGAPLAYEDQSSPRRVLAGRIYTSTEHPPEAEILLHNENSYSQTWPRRVFFHCMTAPGRGGETPLADSQRVYERIAPGVRRRFEELGVMYVRNFGSGPGLDWRTAFQTDDPVQVEAYGRQAGIVCEWRSGGRLRTRQVRPAVLDHPATGARVWFNQTTLFHPAALDPALRDELLALLPESELPSAVYYGDGSPIPSAVVEELLVAYRAETVSFPWQAGDVLLLDNVRVAHGRRPFEGPRRVVVGMAQAGCWPAVFERGA